MFPVEVRADEVLMMARCHFCLVAVSDLKFVVEDGCLTTKTFLPPHLLPIYTHIHLPQEDLWDLSSVVTS